MLFFKFIFRRLKYVCKNLSLINDDDTNNGRVKTN